MSPTPVCDVAPPLAASGLAGGQLKVVFSNVEGLKSSSSDLGGGHFCVKRAQLLEMLLLHDADIGLLAETHFSTDDELKDIGPYNVLPMAVW